MTVTDVQPTGPVSHDVAMPRRRRRGRAASSSRSKLLPYLLIAPTCVVLAVVAGWPLFKIITLSLQKQESGKFALFHNNGTTPWTGITNFRNVLTDSTFWSVAGRTFVFTAVNVVL